MIRFLSTNLGIALAAIVLLGALAPVSGSIPANGGLGYDGRRYAGWVEHFSLDNLARGFASDLPPEERPIPLNVYSVRRVLPSMLVHYAMRALHVPTTREHIITAFTVANVLLLGLATFFWCRAADEFDIGVRGKWLGFIGLLVSYANARMPLYYPILTDTFGLCLGAASLLLYLRNRRLLLALVTYAGAFAWPSILHFGVLLLAFPRDGDDGRGAPRWATRLCAAAAATAALGLIAYVVQSGHVIKSTPVEPWRPALVPSAVIVALWVYAGTRPLVDSRAFWRGLHPKRMIDEPWFAGAGLVWVAVELTVYLLAIPHSRPKMTPGRFLLDTGYTAITQPGCFALAHVLYFGPLVLFLAPYWKRICRSIQRQGTGLVLSFGFALAVGMGSESRKLINFYPFVLLFVVQAIEGVVRSPRHFAAVALAAVTLSKLWLPMHQPIDLPWVGEIDWPALYASSRGPWIDNAWFAAQLLLVGAISLGLLAALRSSASGPSTPRGDRARSGRPSWMA